MTQPRRSQELNKEETYNLEERKEEPALRDNGDCSVYDNQMEHNVTLTEEDKVIISIANKKEGDDQR